jgi:A/G-specific adenine glycosylase
MEAMRQVVHMKLSSTLGAEFRRRIRAYWRRRGRHDLPWRRTNDPYRILVSEVMLQQTQVARVIPKYHQFLRRFPNFAALSRAHTREVLAAWQGLGYNRRALALKRCAEIVTKIFSGKLPSDEKILRTLPGIGGATAGAIVAFAFNRPSVFIETNIRRVFIHFFFPHATAVRDNEIRALVAQTLPRRNIREWYWALMDYGAMLAKRLPENPNTRSARYRRQSPFEGSHRQLRGKILALILKKGALHASEIARALDIPLQKINRALRTLSRDGFLHQTGAVFRIAERTRTFPIPKSDTNKNNSKCKIQNGNKNNAKCKMQISK